MNEQKVIVTLIIILMVEMFIVGWMVKPEKKIYCFGSEEYRNMEQRLWVAEYECSDFCERVHGGDNL